MLWSPYALVPLCFGIVSVHLLYCNGIQSVGVSYCFLLCWQVNFVNTSIKGSNNTRKLTNRHLIFCLFCWFLDLMEFSFFCNLYSFTDSPGT